MWHDFKRSLHYARNGLRYIYQTQANFRYQTFCACLVLVVAAIFQVKRQEWLILVLLITMVLVLEVLNTVFESFLDLIQPKIQHYVRLFKDMLAAMVLLASVAAAVVGIIIFYPYVKTLFVH
jgi:diacylglycerol kinase